MGELVRVLVLWSLVGNLPKRNGVSTVEKVTRLESVGRFLELVTDGRNGSYKERLPAAQRLIR